MTSDELLSQSYYNEACYFSMGEVTTPWANLSEQDKEVWRGRVKDSCAESRSASDVELEVCEDIKARQRRGIAKYGTTVAANPLSQREWLTHAYEEALDLAVYLKRIITVMEAK